jgi:dipeptidyl aminopeptidase/acylaminoacyl peptidase
MLLKNFASIFVFVLLSLSRVHATPATKEFIKSSLNDEKIEFFLEMPSGKGPFPVLLMIHPDQDSPKLGGEMFVKFGQLDFWTNKGFVTVAISQPGYGGSKGDADFCGPKTQQDTLDLINHLRTISEVNPKRIFIYGGSRGAVIASMIATKNIDLSGIVLKSGVYDFVEWSNSRPWYDGIKLDMLWEIGWLNEEKLKDRSAYYLAEKIKTPALVIHGSRDDRAPSELAEKFVRKINVSGGSAQFIKIESEHVIPMPKINGLMEEFFKKHL